ncbi:PTS sugar transporter subunit IIA [Candidatus Latescibacterota bacterium]
MIKGLIVGHSEFGSAVLQAIQAISGSTEDIYTISNIGLSTDDIIDKIRSICQPECQDGLLIFVDLFGGSCWRAAKKAAVPNSRIVTGLNLPMLLSFVSKRSEMLLDELADIMDVDGKRGIRLE